MTASIPAEMKFKLYIEPVAQLKDSTGHYARWTDIRLIRRISGYRAPRIDPTRTLCIGIMCATNCAISFLISIPWIPS